MLMSQSFFFSHNFFRFWFTIYFYLALQMYIMSIWFFLILANSMCFNTLLYFVLQNDMTKFLLIILVLKDSFWYEDSNFLPSMKWISEFLGFIFIPFTWFSKYFSCLNFIDFGYPQTLLHINLEKHTGLR